MDCGPRISHCLKVQCEDDEEAIVVKYCGQKCSQAKCAGAKSAKVKDCAECAGDLCNSANQIGLFGENLWLCLMAAFVPIIRQNNCTATLFPAPPAGDEQRNPPIRRNWVAEYYKLPRPPKRPIPPPPSPIHILPPVAKTQEIFCHCKRTSAYGTMPKEQYMCQLCANHGQYNQPKKGHKQKCPNRNCACQLCALNTKRRVLDQLERQWRVKKAKGTSKSSERTPEEAKARKRKEKGQENAKQTIGLFDDVECTAKTAAEAMWCSNLPETVKKCDRNSE
ncbi:hypothetical protein niasHT_036057 [Heterodera trifolii]|uniref:DM domain-containing protein n=1 Tax=Heterodera trifolii TaxID=157864 RepID=A0ABD2IN66_9BILA